MTDIQNTDTTHEAPEATPKVTDKAKRKAPKVKAKGAKAKAVTKVAQPDAACPFMSAYPRIKAWPAKAGTAPDKVLIASARALLGSSRSAGSKRELAIAAYLRADSGTYAVGLVADALQRVCGGSFNPLLNVINADIERNMNLGKCIKAKVADGKATSYRLELNAKGRARVAKALLAWGLAMPVEPAQAPAGENVTHAAPEGHGEHATA